MKDKNIFTEANNTLKERNEAEMWARIAQMNWGNPGYDYKAIAKLAYNSWGETTFLKIRDFCEMRVYKLLDRIKEYNKAQTQIESAILFGGDDSMNDVLWHIVGLGELEYRKAISNPLRIKARYNTGYKQPNGYAENFSYCFHKPAPETVTIPVTGTTCWCCGASPVPPTQKEMLRDFGHHFSNISENELVNFAMMVLGDLPEEILESYYIKTLMQKND